MSGVYDLALLPGDGIGPEVMNEAVKVLGSLKEVFNLDLRLESIPCGGKYYLDNGEKNDWPRGSEAKCRDADAILLAAVGWPRSSGTGPVTMKNGKMAGFSPVIGNRMNLDLYANVRPVELFPGVKHMIHGRRKKVWQPEHVNMVFVRENTEGLYAGIGGSLTRKHVQELAIDTRIITKNASERVLRFAFELCKQRKQGRPRDGKKQVTAILKDNVMDGCRLFRDLFFAIGKEYQEIETETTLVDAFTQFLIREPERYDVLVTTNLFGDIVTDLASVLQGGMGLAVGCNIGENHSMFEPIHGSAPPLAGKNKANPLAMILACKEALKWLGRRHGDSQLIEAATLLGTTVRAQVAEGETLTEDLVGVERGASCSAVGDCVIARLRAAS